MNFEFTKLRVRSLTTSYLEVSWEVENTTIDPLDYSWLVQRSESPLGPWDDVSQEFSDRYLFLDSRVNVFNKHRSYYYRIKSSEKSDTANVVYSRPISLAAEPDLIASEIQLLEQTLWREYAGRECFLLPRRTSGQYCPLCMDVGGKGSTFRKLRSGCVTCYDTQFARGFLDPIRIYCQIDPSPKTVQLVATGEQQVNQTTARMGAFPAVKPGDVIVEAENKRWRVVTAGGTERLRSKVHQELTLYEINRGDVEYKVPLDLGNIQEFEPSAKRNFTNPQNLESAEDEALASTLATYGIEE